MDYELEIGKEISNEAGTWRLVVVADPDGVNPREEDVANLGVIVAEYPRYDLPQEDSTNLTGRHFVDHVGNQDFRVIARYLRLFHGASVVLPIYAGSGNELELSPGDASDEPTAGNYIGVIFDTPETRREGWGDLVPDVETVTENLRSELQMHNTWANGQMTGWVVERATSDDPGNHDWETVESCFGYFSIEEAREQGTPELEQIAAGALEAHTSDQKEEDHVDGS